MWKGRSTSWKMRSRIFWTFERTHSKSRLHLAGGFFEWRMIYKEIVTQVLPGEILTDIRDR
jgi:hypothetical protein